MAYVKNIWVDQDVERPKTYEVTNNQDGSITLTDSFGLVTELGTPVNEVNMNHIEDGIDGCAIRKHNLTETFNLGEWVLGGTGDNEGIYKSLIPNNVGNAITDETTWEKVEMGGGGGLEIGDIGIAPLGIDETQNKRRYLNGQLIIQDQFVSFTTKLKNAVTLDPSIACTEQEWQATVTLSVNGTCDKFVIDNTAGTIRLPKYPNYCNKEYLNASVSVYGNGMSLGLIGGTSGTSTTGIASGSSSIYTRTGVYGTPAGTSISGSVVSGNDRSLGVTTDPSNSGLTGTANLSNATSELIACKWFIQVATGVEESVDVTREIELNNPFCLLDYKYSEYELDNISWLRSNGQWNAKAVYTDAYDLLLKIYNGTETKAGVSVKLSTETYADTDFVLNTTNETFRLPLKVALASGKAVVGNGTALGLTNGTYSGGMARDHNYSMTAFAEIYGSPVGSTATGTDYFERDLAMGVTTDPTKSGLELSDANLYLYFYVGETVQNANLINAGRIEEKLVDLIPDNSNLIAGYAMPSDTYIDLTLGASGSTYTAPANGWFVFSKLATANFQYALLKNKTCGDLESFGITSSGSGTSVFLPAKKNDEIGLTYTTGGTLVRFRFVYAQGSETEAN